MTAWMTEKLSRSEWWQGLPRWLKLVFLIVAMPAWLIIIYCVLTSQNKGAVALAAFAVFAGATLLFVIFDRRRGRLGEGGVDVGPDFH